MTNGPTHAAAAQQENDAIARRHLRGDVPIPGGSVVPLEEFTMLAGLGVDPADSDLLAHPEKILKKPNPKSRYVWADREGGGKVRTAGAIRSGRYRPVKKDEVKPDADGEFGFETHKGTTEYVMWRDCILCECPERYARAQYDAPVGRYIRSLVADQEKFKAAVQSESKGQAVGLDVLATKAKLGITEG